MQKACSGSCGNAGRGLELSSSRMDNKLWGEKQAREIHPHLSHCIKHCCVALCYWPPSLAALIYAYLHQRDLEVFQSISVIEDNTFLSAMQHAGSMHRHSEVRMGDNLPSHCNTNVFSLVTPNDQSDPLPRATASRSPADGCPRACPSLAQCQLQPPDFTLQRGAMPLKMLRYKCRSTQKP